MAKHRSKKQDHRSRRDAVRHPVRFISLSTAATTFITLGLSPLSSMPVSKADGEDVIIEQIINSLSAVDPTAALDLNSWLSSLDAALQGAANFDPSSLAGGMPDIDSALQGVTVVDPSSLAGGMPDIDSALQGVTVVDPSSVAGAMPDIDSALQGVTVVDPSSVAGGMPDIDSALSAASTSADPTAVPAGAGDLAQLYETYIYDPMHAFDQRWIDGATVLGDRTVHWDNALNAFWGDIGGKGILIGNGADGIQGDPDGGAGGLLFGDGGAGWNSNVAGEAGGAGGIAYHGNGGAGGDGYEGSMGGAGGDTYYGIAGNGGMAVPPPDTRHGRRKRWRGRQRGRVLLRSRRQRRARGGCHRRQRRRRRRRRQRRDTVW